MNNQSKLKNIFTRKNIIIISLVLLSVLWIVFYFMRLSSRVAPISIPIPVIPSVTPTGPTPPLDTTNPFNPEQKLIFLWPSSLPSLPKNIQEFSIKTPLVNPAKIALMANKMGFVATDQSPESDENNYIWINSNSSLFGSPRQNQIFFNSNSLPAIHSATINQSEAVSLAKSAIVDLFGNTFLNSLEDTPEVNYLNYSKVDSDEEPDAATPDTANIISVNFKQELNKLPIISLSRKGETISVVFDTNKKIYLLYVYGGYSEIKEEKTSPVLTMSELQSVAPVQAMRISYSASMDQENLFTDSATITTTVNSIELGYYQRSDNSLFPIFIIKGDMKSSKAGPYPAVFIVPAVKGR